MTTVSASTVEALIKILSTFNVQNAVAVWESQDTQAKIINGLIAEDELLKIAGLFFPPVAIVANDEELVIEGYEILSPVLQMLDKKFPYVQPPGTIEAWGVTVSDKGLIE